MIALYYFFSMSTNLAALTSIYIIFFSQVSSLGMAFVTGIPEFDMLSLVMMIISGIGGGILGRSVAKRLSVKGNANLFTVVLITITLICLVNIVRYSI